MLASILLLGNVTFRARQGGTDDEEMAGVEEEAALGLAVAALLAGGAAGRAEPLRARLLRARGSAQAMWVWQPPRRYAGPTSSGAARFLDWGCGAAPPAPDLRTAWWSG